MQLSEISKKVHSYSQKINGMEVRLYHKASEV